MRVVNRGEKWAVVARDSGDERNPGISGAHFQIYSTRVTECFTRLEEDPKFEKQLGWATLWGVEDWRCAIVALSDVYPQGKNNEFGVEVP